MVADKYLSRVVKALGFNIHDNNLFILTKERGQNRRMNEERKEGRNEGGKEGNMGTMDRLRRNE